MTFNSEHGGTGVSESFEGVSQTDVSSVKTGETVTVQSTVTDEKRVSLCFSKNTYFMNNIQPDMTG